MLYAEERESAIKNVPKNVSGMIEEIEKKMKEFSDEIVSL
jgi:predicted DNA-binding transcriptional regulator